MKVRTEARRTAILEEAARLFQEAGYERASMNELARRCGGSKATLYGYFSSKEALFVAVVRAIATQHLSDAVVEMQQSAQGDRALPELLTRFGERMLAVLTHDASALAVYRMVVGEAGHSNVGQLFYEAGPAQSIQALAGVMAQAVERGQLKPWPPRVLALQFLALVTTETEERVYQTNPPPLATEEISAMVERAVALFLGGAAASQ
ncbi:MULTISPECIES: TetR/AcrR family transcriptional regulator [unclassified Acidovorax]|uniref:TetR/AcrR family transcriptional regulator n=1 Tax=unclassified Acidovorax TaxID=2684926 RepID=UPI002882D459|nr:MULTISPECIES: TetR/AcrR family transcriptional regulator [unclassified Acidovorax]